MYIKTIRPEQLPEHDRLALAHGSLFNTSSWAGLFGEQMEMLGIHDNGGVLIGGFSLYTQKKFGLNICRRAPFTPSGGPFYRPAAVNPVARTEEFRAVLELVVNHIEQRSPAICMVSLPPQVKDALPFYWKGYKVQSCITYALDLTLGPDALWARMSSGRRKNIQKARKDGLVVRQMHDMTAMHDLVLATFARQNKGLDREVLHRILFSYANESNSYAFITFNQGQPVAGCFVVHDHRTAYYLLGGYGSDLAHHGAGALAMWSAIGHAHSLGLKVFDFEGSMIPEIERYIRGFGGEVVPYLTVNKAWLGIEMLLKVLKRNVF